MFMLRQENFPKIFPNICCCNFELSDSKNNNKTKKQKTKQNKKNNNNKKTNKQTKKQFESAAVNEPAMFESLKFYCIHPLVSLRKHTYSNIYWKFQYQKLKSFRQKIFFFIFLLKT